jgi:hypothetical protein
VRSCLRRPRLRITVPIALLAGVAVSLVNHGGMLLSGHIDAQMCAICGLDFLVPFAALNVALLAPALRRPVRYGEEELGAAVQSKRP